MLIFNISANIEINIYVKIDITIFNIFRKTNGYR